MNVQVRYFAGLREALGDGERVDVPEGSTVGSLRHLLASRGGPHAQALGPGRTVRAALDLAIVDDDAVLAEGAELAFFPPVTGG